MPLLALVFADSRWDLLTDRRITPICASLIIWLSSLYVSAFIWFLLSYEDVSHIGLRAHTTAIWLHLNKWHLQFSSIFQISSYSVALGVTASTSLGEHNSTQHQRRWITSNEWLLFLFFKPGKSQISENRISILIFYPSHKWVFDPLVCYSQILTSVSDPHCQANTDTESHSSQNSLVSRCSPRKRSWPSRGWLTLQSCSPKCGIPVMGLVPLIVDPERTLNNSFLH